MKKVVILSNPDRGYVVGGAENARLMLARELVSHGYEVTLFGDVEPDGIDDGMNYVQIKGNWARFTGWLNFLRAMRGIKPDLLVCKVLNPLLPIYLLICRLSGAKLFYFAEHDWELENRPDKRINGWRWHLFWFGVQFVDMIFVQNPVQLKGFRKKLYWNKKRVVITPNIPLMEGLESPTEPGDTFTWIGSYRPHKNPNWVHQIAERVPGEKFLLVLDCKGDSNLENMFKQKARDIPNFSFIPGVGREDLPGILENAAITMITSEGEGFPNVAVEAWSKSRGVISTPSNALSHMRPEQGVIICNTIEEFAETISNITREKLEQCNNGGLQYFKENYNSKKIIDGITQYI